MGKQQRVRGLSLAPVVYEDTVRAYEWGYVMLGLQLP
jgi:hypothetical protein